MLKVQSCRVQALPITRGQSQKQAGWTQCNATLPAPNAKIGLRGCMSVSAMQRAVSAVARSGSSDLSLKAESSAARMNGRSSTLPQSSRFTIKGESQCLCSPSEASALELLSCRQASVLRREARSSCCSAWVVVGSWMRNSRAYSAAVLAH